VVERWSGRVRLRPNRDVEWWRDGVVECWSVGVMACESDGVSPGVLAAMASDAKVRKV
jgi:hypothetical protein